MDRFWELPRYPFILGAVEHAPEQGGVYALFCDDEPIYIGVGLERDGGIRVALLTHLEGSLGDVATSYTWEIAIQPGTRERDLISAFIGKHKRMPRFQRAA